MYTYKAKVINVYDGDTITVIVDLGFKIKQEIKVRLAFINTPELKGESREMGLISKEFLKNLILNKDIIIKTIQDKKGVYGRYLAEIYLDELNVNNELLRLGYADRY